MVAEEKHYTVAEIAQLWGVCDNTIISLFRDQPGVLKLGRRTLTRRKRQYVTLRIPASVLSRVHSERSL